SAAPPTVGGAVSNRKSVRADNWTTPVSCCRIKASRDHSARRETGSERYAGIRRPSLGCTRSRWERNAWVEYSFSRQYRACNKPTGNTDEACQAQSIWWHISCEADHREPVRIRCRCTKDSDCVDEVGATSCAG